MALVGIQPQLRHTPPGRSFSTSATRKPYWAARIAGGSPPGPPPTMTTSNALCSAIVGPLELRLTAGRRSAALRFSSRPSSTVATGPCLALPGNPAHVGHVVAAEGVHFGAESGVAD